jgi:predicted phosphoribosyltransferase
MRAAIALLRKQHPARIVVAVPVAPPSTYQELDAEDSSWDAEQPVWA